MRPTYPKIITRISWLLIIVILTNCLNWGVDEFGFKSISVPKAKAQSATQTTYYFKGDAGVTPTRTASNYFGVTGPNNEESSDTDEVSDSPTNKTTALGMIPVEGPITDANTSLSKAAYGATGTRSTAANADKLWFRTFMMPIASGTTFNSSTTYAVAVSADESDSGANAYLIAFVYIYDSNSDSIAQPLAGPTQHGTEIGTADNGRIWLITNPANYTYVSDNYDYLAVEIWVNFTNTNGTQYTTSLWWGGNTNIAEGTGNTTPASYLQVDGTAVNTFDPIYFQANDQDREPTTGSSSQTGDSFQGGTLDDRRMITSHDSGSETNGQTVSTTVGNWRMNMFASPPLAAQTIPIGTWVIHMHGYESNAAANAQFRYMVYTWDPDDTIGDTIKTVTSSNDEWGTATTNNQVEILFTTSGTTTISDGERLVVEINVITVTSSGAYTVNHYFGGTSTPGTNSYDSCILPPMNYASTPTPLAYLSQQYDQLNYRFDEDNDDHASNGNDTHAAWTNGDGNAIAENTAATFDDTVNFRLRVQIANKGGETDTLSPTLYYCNIASCSYTQATLTSTDIQIEATANFVMNYATTQQLTAQTPGWDFATGRLVDDSDTATTSVSMTAWTYTEYEWSLEGITNGTYDFRVRDSSTELTTYTQTPRVIINGPVYIPDSRNWRFYDAENVADPANTTGTDDTAGDAMMAEETDDSPATHSTRIVYQGNAVKLRIAVGETGGEAAGADVKYKLQFDTDSEFRGVADVEAQGGSTAAWRYYNGANVTDDATISTARLTGTTAGRHNEDAGVGSGAGSTFDPAVSTTYEHEFTIQFNPDVVIALPPDTIYYFRLQYMENSTADGGSWATVAKNASNSYPQLDPAAAFDIEVSRAPGDVSFGIYNKGDDGTLQYVFTTAEGITFWDKRNTGTYDVTASAIDLLKNGGGDTIPGEDITWTSALASLTGSFASSKTGMVSEDAGTTMEVDVTAYGADAASEGKGGFFFSPTIDLANLESRAAGLYEGTITITIV